MTWAEKGFRLGLRIRSDARFRRGKGLITGKTTDKEEKRRLNPEMRWERGDSWKAEGEIEHTDLERKICYMGVIGTES